MLSRLKNKSLLLLLLGFFGSAQGREVRWPWKKIDTSNIYFPKNFMWGVGTSAGQIHNETKKRQKINLAKQEIKETLSNWGRWEQGRHADGSPHIWHDQRIGEACDHLKKWPEDIELIKRTGVNSYRFSVSWSLIEPECGVFDQDMIDFYKKFCQELLKAGIEPMITLHHFTHPEWFEAKGGEFSEEKNVWHGGGFEKKENIKYFVRFCKKIFAELGDQVHLWCTINEPGVYVFQGYLRGVFPPGHVLDIKTARADFKRAAKVLRNLLEAHVEAYFALKDLPHGDEAQIGIVQQVVQFEPYGNWHFFENLVAKYINLFMTDAIMNFLETGRFKCKVPLMAHVKDTIKDAPYSYDFIGLNYYSHVLVQFKLPEVIVHGTGVRKGDIMTDMPYALYPEGLYRAIDRVSVLGVPIYITECGIADKKDDRRKLFLERYLFALSQALKDGYDVRGFYYWSLMDNFEWDMGYDMKFGLYAVDFETKERTLRDGARYYIDVIKRFS